MRTRLRRAGPDDRGETLVELMVAIGIIGVTVVAVLGGIAASVKMTDIHRKQARANAFLRAAAEQVESTVAALPTGYRACGSAGAGVAAYEPSVDIAVPASSGFEANVTNVESWDAAASPPRFVACASTDSGVQRVTIRVRSTDDRAIETLGVIIRKPCRPVTEFPGEALCS
jgi:type II secretory pathway pseudopilin PulG